MYRLIILFAAIVAVTSRNVNNRIIGGDETSIEKHPYQAALIDGERNNFRCGACIVNKHYVVTTTICIYDNRNKPDTLQVRVGSSRHYSGGVLHNVTQIIMHHLFNRGNKDYDIAVLKLQEPISFSASVAPVSLAPIEEKLKTGQDLVVTGWGFLKYRHEEWQSREADVLQEVRIELLDRTVCQLSYKKKLGYELTPRMFCAGVKSKPTKGPYLKDEGSPIVNERKQLVGVVSWGVASDLIAFPGVITDVTDPVVRDFIQVSAELCSSFPLLLCKWVSKMFSLTREQDDKCRKFLC